MRWSLFYGSLKCILFLTQPAFCWGKIYRSEFIGGGSGGGGRPEPPPPFIQSLILKQILIFRVNSTLLVAIKFGLYLKPFKINE